MSRNSLSSFRRACLVPSWIAAWIVGAAGSARAGDWYVDVQASDCVHADGSAAAPFCSIGAAVAVASSGDAIHVAPGSYFELVTLDRSLRLVGTGGAAATTVDGGALGSVVTVTGAAAVELEGLTLTHGKAQFGGGLFVGDGGSGTLTSCTVSANEAEAVDGFGVRVASFGGGVAARNATVVVAGSMVADNFASAGGGGIYMDGGALTVDGSTVARNRAGDPGGFDGSGGGIDFEGEGVLRLSRTTIEENRNDDAPGGAGGGVSYVGHDFVADHLIVRNNRELGSGGGIFAWWQMTLTDSLLEGNSAGGGGGVFVAYNGRIERCTVRGNRAFGSLYAGGKGGGISAAGTITDCLIENNTTETVAGGSSCGGGLSIDMNGTVTRCVIRGNVSTSTLEGGLGGGVYVGAPFGFDFTDCAIIGNEATAADTGTAGSGGGVANTAYHWGAVTFTRCTIAGNAATGHSATAGGDAGGLFVGTGVPSPTLSHVILAGNRADSSSGAPDCRGTISSAGYDLIGDTTGCTVTGDGTGNQLDVDPLFADPGNGDFTLAIDSPALDAGDPAAWPGGTDVAGHPRVLDGNLDRAMVLDLGAFEFDHVNFAVSGTPIPGAVLTFTTTGTAGLPVFLCVGIADSELRIAPLGSLFVDLTSPWYIAPWGTIPDQRSLTVDPALPVPATFVLQPFALDSASRTGNLGNAFRLDFE